MADFNEDGVADVVLWSPHAGDQQGRSPCRLTLVDGRSGQTLWVSPEIMVEDESRLIWPEAVVGDLDGDLRPEVIVARHRGFGGESPGYACELGGSREGRTGVTQRVEEGTKLADSSTYPYDLWMRTARNGC